MLMKVSFVTSSTWISGSKINPSLADPQEETEHFSWLVCDSNFQAEQIKKSYRPGWGGDSAYERGVGARRLS